MSKKRFKIVTLDGPAGAGKSTIAQKVAQQLGYLYVDTGALYRALTWKALRQKIDWQDPKQIQRVAAKSLLKLQKTAAGKLNVLLDGKNVNRWIRSRTVSNHVSLTAAVPSVRKKLDTLQRQLALTDNIVMEGRDIGTTIFPQAQFKFYLDASVAERARRRLLQLQSKGESVSHAELEAEIRARDHKDRQRSISPLRCPQDAIIIDSTHMTPDQVIQTIVAHCRLHL